MILENKKLAAEIMLHYVLNKTDYEVYKFLVDYSDGDVFEFLHDTDGDIGKSKGKAKFYNEVLRETRKRKTPLSDEELKDMLDNEELSEISEGFKKEIWRIKNNNYSNFDLEQTIKPTLLEVIKYAKTYSTILMNLDTKTFDSFCNTVCGKISKINNISYKKKSTELSMGNFEDIMNLIKNDQNDSFLSTGYSALDRLLVGRYSKG